MKKIRFDYMSICFIVAILSLSCNKMSKQKDLSDHNDTPTLPSSTSAGNEEYYDEGEIDAEQDSEAKIDAIYTKYLLGTWYVDVSGDRGSDGDLSCSFNGNITMTLNSDFSYSRHINFRMVMKGKFREGAMMREYGITIDIEGKQTGTWYVDNSNLVQQVDSWKITPSYHKHHGESPSQYRNYENMLINESSSLVKEMMSDMKSLVSQTTTVYIVEMPTERLKTVGADGEEKIWKRK